MDYATKVAILESLRLMVVGYGIGLLCEAFIMYFNSVLNKLNNNRKNQSNYRDNH